MNLRKLFYWNKPITETTSNQAGVINQNNPNTISESLATSGSNVVPISSVNYIDRSDLGMGLADATSETASLPIQVKGLMNTPELIEFFDDKYFGLGRHNGSTFKTQEALELGKKTLISKFQNTLITVSERKQAIVNKLELELISIDGISTPISNKLRLACEQLKREINLLQSQTESAGSQQGWVLDALNRYQIGFLKGLNDAIEFEMLAGQ